MDSSGQCWHFSLTCFDAFYQQFALLFQECALCLKRRRHWWKKCNRRSPFLVPFLVYQLYTKWKILVKAINVILTKPSEVLGHELWVTRWQEPILGWNFVSVRVLFINSLRRAVCETVTIQIFRNETFDVSCVSRDVLLSNLIIRSANPILSKATSISENNLVALQFVGGFAIKSVFRAILIAHSEV